MKYWIGRLSNPLRGLWYAFTSDFAVRFEILVFGVVGIPAVYFLFGPLTARELLLLIFCWFFIVVTEIQNTAMEVALTKLHPAHDAAQAQDESCAAIKQF